MTLLVGGGVFLLGNKSQPTGVTPVVSPTVQSTPIAEGTANWKTFTDSTEGVSFSYPPSFREDAPEGAVNSLEILLASVSSDESVYRIVNYNQRANVSVSKTDKKAADCYTHPRDGSPLTQSETVNGRVFKKGKQGTAAAGTTYATELYRTLKGNTCYEAALSVVVSSDWNGVDRNAAESSQLEAFGILRQILFTFAFISQSEKRASPVASPIPKTVKPPLLDTSNWQAVTLSSIRFKVPQEAKYNISTNNEVFVYMPNLVIWQVVVQVRSYDGGSRRAWWIKVMQALTEDVEKYMRFQEVQLGQVAALAVFADNGWWQGGYASPILIARGTTIAVIHGGQNLGSDGSLQRSSLTDTVASTVEFL